MDYDFVLQELKRESPNALLISGPQRSGTTICAKMLATDLGYTFYPEERINVFSPDAVRKLIERESRFVLQCPALCHLVHMVDATIIMMIRLIAEIVASEERIGWQGNRQGELSKYGVSNGVISEVKYDHWMFRQRALTKSWHEVDYRSLVNHPLWIPDQERANFESRQISHHSVSIVTG